MSYPPFNEEYRGFVFVLHEKHGLLLLHCTRKKKKPHHFQLPGGRIDKEDFVQANKCFNATDNNSNKLLLEAAKIGAARELFEETGVDVRLQLDRLLPSVVTKGDEDDLLNMLMNRLFFSLKITDADVCSDDGMVSIVAEQRHIKLKLSHEHSGFKFQPDMKTAVQELTWHSGGKVSKALDAAVMLTEGREQGIDQESSVTLTPRGSSLFPKDQFCCFKTNK